MLSTLVVSIGQHYFPFLKMGGGGSLISCPHSFKTADPRKIKCLLVFARFDSCSKQASARFSQIKCIPDRVCMKNEKRRDSNGCMSDYWFESKDLIWSENGGELSVKI